MFVPRTFIIAGLALIAIALGASGHGLWWLIGLVWALGGTRRGWHACTSDRAADRAPDRAPDPSHDRHEAFPVR